MGVTGDPDGWVVGRSVKNDTSPALRRITPMPVKPKEEEEEEANLNPPIPSGHRDAPDPVVQQRLGPLAMPAPILNFDGIPFPGVACNCTPPDTNGEVGATQYVQMVNKGLQVFDKITGVSVLGPVGISTLWSGFGGVCESNGRGDPVVVYDQLANRWVVTQFAGVSIATDECVAVSTTNDAMGTWHRYDFNLGSNFFDYPKLSVWPDAYYLAMNVFNAAGTAFLGHQPFALDRSAMLVGNSATFISPGLQSTALGSMLPGDLDGSILPPAGAPNPWLSTDGATWPLYRFHVDFATPANSTWTLGGSLSPAGYTELCTATRNCVPQLGTTDGLDAVGDRPMFRLAYRRFADGHEALVGNRTVSSSGVGAIRWWEINNATSGVPSFVQQSTYQPDTTWRWMGSVAMDTQGNLALGFSASSSSINPQLRYAGRLAADPAGVLAQGEATLFAGTGSQTGSSNRWGDYSDMTVDPVDDCTFWYTNEYYSTTTSFNWRTRIGNFKFPGCSLAPDFFVNATPTSQNICVGSNAAYTIGVGSAGGFNSAVTLSASGNPGTAGFVPNQVTPPANGTVNSTLTISGAAAGSYNFNVTGTDGATNRSTPLNLNVAAAAPAAPALTAPADASTGVSVLPTFTWGAVAQAVSYDIQVASDPAFSTIVASSTGLTSTSYTPAAPLTLSTAYYWRVRANNVCGTSSYSVLAAFMTADVATASFCRTPNVAIPDNSTAGVTDSQMVATAATLIDLNVSVRSTHTFVGDLIFTVTNVGSATSVTIIDRPGIPASTFGCANNHINATLDDGAGSPVESQCATSTGTTPPPYAIDGTLTPNNLLAAFNGQALNATWQINASDREALDTGTLNDWCLIATYGIPFSTDLSDLASGYGVAWHTGSGALRLGPGWTADTSFAAGTDDATDDGVAFITPLQPGRPATVRVTVQGTPVNGRWLRLWFDWDGNDVFDTTDKVYDGAAINGDNDLTVAVPSGQASAVNYRVRLYDSVSAPAAAAPEAIDTGSYGGATDGEVEDGTSQAPTAVTLSGIAAAPAGPLALPGVLPVALAGLAALAGAVGLRRRR